MAKAFRMGVVDQLSRDKAERAAEVPKPDLAKAQEHVRFFLPKNSSGELLSLRCSEKEFSAHVGAGVSLYMRFQKVTGYMFLAASVLVLPQLVSNIAGGALDLPVPFQGCPGSEKGFMDYVSGVMGSLTYFFFSSLLGNAEIAQSSTHGWVHLVSELMLCCMFCIYVYWIWQHNSHALEEVDAVKVRASDFAVCVRKLPPHNTDPHGLKAR